jgi:hypothetical protein
MHCDYTTVLFCSPRFRLTITLVLQTDNNSSRSWILNVLSTAWKATRESSSLECCHSQREELAETLKRAVQRQ